jgi:hypothetical protein
MRDHAESSLELRQRSRQSVRGGTRRPARWCKIATEARDPGVMAWGMHAHWRELPPLSPGPSCRATTLYLSVGARCMPAVRAQGLAVRSPQGAEGSSPLFTSVFLVQTFVHTTLVELVRRTSSPLTARKPNARSMNYIDAPPEGRGAPPPPGLHGMVLARLFTPLFTAPLLCTPVSGGEPGLHLVEVLLLRHTGVLERLHERVFPRPLG